MESRRSISVSLSIDEMASTIRSQLNYYRSLRQYYPDSSKRPLIYRVQKQIRDVDPVAYEPVYVAIGPYHHSSPLILSMEREKWMCMRYILGLNNRRELQDYLSAIMNVEEQVRCCYQDDISIESSNFIKLLLVDSCFLLHSLYATNEVVERSPNVYDGRDRGTNASFLERVGTFEIQSESSMTISSNYGHSNILATEAEQGEADSDRTDTRVDLGHGQSQVDSLPTYNTVSYESNCITRDILLLENQIPLFVIKLVYEILAYNKALNVPLTETLAKYMEDILQYYPTCIKESSRPKEFYHLLHLCHIYFKPSQNIPEQCDYHNRNDYLHSVARKCVKHLKVPNQHESLNLFVNHQPTHLKDRNYKNRWRRALQYYEAGVQFRRREYNRHDPHSLLDIAFDRGALEIPTLPIDDKTSIIFRNLIAFEQACPEVGNYMTAYIAFMCQLINTAEDVTLLCRRGIVAHHLLCDADVSNIFGKLGKNVDFDMNGNYYLKSLCQQLEAHYQNRVKRWMAWLWKNHFSNPWLSLAVIAAAIVLVCTILQTWFSLQAYMKPTS